MYSCVLDLLFLCYFLEKWGKCVFILYRCLQQSKKKCNYTLVWWTNEFIRGTLQDHGCSETALSAESIPQCEWRPMQDASQELSAQLEGSSNEKSSLPQVYYRASPVLLVYFLRCPPSPQGSTSLRFTTFPNIVTTGRNRCSNAPAYERHFTFTQQHSTPGFPSLSSFHKMHLI